MTELCEKLILTIKEAATLLNVSVGTIRNEIKRGRLKSLRFGIEGKAVRIKREDLLALVDMAQKTVPLVLDIQTGE